MLSGATSQNPAPVLICAPECKLLGETPHYCLDLTIVHETFICRNVGFRSTVVGVKTKEQLLPEACRRTVIFDDLYQVLGCWGTHFIVGMT